MIDEKKIEEAADEYSDMYLDMEDEEQSGVREVGCTFGADPEDKEMNIKDTVMAMENFWIIVE